MIEKAVNLKRRVMGGWPLLLRNLRPINFVYYISVSDTNYLRKKEIKCKLIIDNFFCLHPTPPLEKLLDLSLRVRVQRIP